MVIFAVLLINAVTAARRQWPNPVVNRLQDLVSAFEPKQGAPLRRRPRDPCGPVFEARVVRPVLVAGSVMGAIALAVLAVLSESAITLDAGLEAGQGVTIALMLIMLLALRHFAIPGIALSGPGARLHRSALHTPGLGESLDVSPNSPDAFGLQVLAAPRFLVVEETRKAVARSVGRKSGGRA